MGDRTFATGRERCKRILDALYSPIQLFDERGDLLETYGVAGIATLMRSSTETRKGTMHVRSFVSPLNLNNKLVGFLQIQVPTDDRDAAMDHFIAAMAFMAPIVLLGLGFASFYVSDKATIGIRRNMKLFANCLLMRVMS